MSDRIYSVLDGLEFLEQALREQHKKGLISKKTYDELRKRINDDTASFDKNSDQLLKSAKKISDAKKAAKAFATSSIRGAEALRKNREDFRSLNPAVKASAEAAKLAGSATGKLISGLGDAINVGTSFFGPMAKLIGVVGGGALNVLGDFMEENAKRAAALGQAFGSFALGELQNVVDSYRQLGSVGGITARGMTGVYDDAIRAGMSTKEYSQLIAEQGTNLSQFAGGVTAGAESLGKVSQANEGFKQEYLKLGYTFNDQQKYTAEYLKRNRVLQSANINDTDKLAEGSRAYMDLLDEVSRLTGQNKDEAAKELEEQQSNVRFSAVQRAITKRTGSETIAKQMSLVSSGIKAFGGQGLAVGFQDLMSGMGTDAAKEFDRAMGGEGQKIADMVKNGEIDANQALAMVHQSAKRMRANVVTDKFLSSAQRSGTVMDNIAEGITKLALSENLTVEGLKKHQEDQKKAREAKDKETESITNAQVVMRKMAIEFDKIVRDKVFPLATEAVDSLTDLVVDFVNIAGKTLGFAGNVSRRVRGQTLMEEAAESPGEFTGEVKTGEGLTGKSLSGIQPTLAGRMEQVAREFKEKTGKDVNVTSAKRTVEEQAKLYADYQAGKTKYPVAPPGRSKHDRGLAIDVDSQIANKLDSMGLLAKYGLGRPVAGDPVHIEVVSAATGGVFSGPKSGFPAVLHGNEAVVPLPNGTDIPVQPTGLSDSTEQQIKTIRRQNQIIAELISAARTNNAANNRLLSLKAS